MLYKAKVDRPEVIKNILKVLKDPRFCETDGDTTTYVYDDIFIAGDTYQVVLSPSAHGNYPEASITYRGKPLYTGSFLGDACDETTASLKLVAEHMADEFIKYSGCITMFLHFTYRLNDEQAA
jgi:hypothetical protein